MILHVVRADVLHMPFKDSVFDVVFNEGVVEHLQDPSSALGEMVRVTRKFGVVVFSVPNLYSFHTLGKFVLSGSAAISRPYGFERSFSKREVTGLFQRVGLENIVVHGIGLFYGFARYMPHPAFRVFHGIYVRVHCTKLGVRLTECFGFQLIGKGEKR
jgi:SAM-dependent methyltransferase